MDLSQSIPRSPKKKVSGIVMIPRMLDKARAYNSKTLGEYIYPCPLDRIILEFLDIDYREFACQAQNLTDEKIDLWINEKTSHKSKDDKENINKKLLERKPDTQESIDRFNEIRDKINPTLKNITTWVDLIDLEENKFLLKSRNDKN